MTARPICVSPVRPSHNAFCSADPCVTRKERGSRRVYSNGAQVRRGFSFSHDGPVVHSGRARMGRTISTWTVWPLPDKITTAGSMVSPDCLLALVVNPSDQERLVATASVGARR